VDGLDVFGVLPCPAPAPRATRFTGFSCRSA
jgi:hypothetical protein